ncbi:large ribosomal subunit protein uL4m [Panulirus ornatus]|uniref:large ribosomal subunit protein uL4m n=1 Tax=Panulirus ornatus TaxID=150431 RepID=UPI003A8B9CDB
MALQYRSFSTGIRNVIRSLGSTVGQQTAITSAPAPLILDDNHRNVVKAREAWIETLDASTDSPQVGLMHLHPRIFAACPRLDIIHENVVWQRKYRMVNTAHTKLRSEVRGGGKKPYPQKGTGRARHGSIRSPLWVGGGVCHGPRAFTTQFYMLPFANRIQGLTSTLSAKFAQDDIKFVDSLDMPSDEAGYIEKLCENRCWGPSVLFVDDTDVMPRNIIIATETIQHMNLIPVYGLNVHSMLKHETLVLTVSAARCIEERILYHLNKPDFHAINCEKFRT